MADDEKLLERIKRDYRLAVDSSSESRASQEDDERFAAGSPDNKWQWDQLALATRNGDQTAARPALTINQLPQHIRQVTNEQRQNRPAIKVLPVDDNADVETAEVFNGLIRHIQVASDSDIAIDTACEHQVTNGEGFFRVLAEYCDSKSFDQDLRIKRIKNWRSVRMDPRIQNPTGEDAKFCFIEEEVSKEEFKARWPNASEVSWQGADADALKWRRGDSLIVAEYYYIEEEQKRLCLWPDGAVTIGDEAKRYGDQKPVAERTTILPTVHWCKTNGFEILAPDGAEKIKDVPGEFIPVFRVVGNEWVIEGETVVSGIVRNAKDAQRMVNYWTSQEAEMLALAPKAPFVGASGQFECFESKWRQANQVNYPYLEYNPIVQEGTMVPPPQRMPPPMPPSGIIEAKLQANDAVKQTTGQYNPSLGAQSNETSGKAIMARQRESDVGTYHYVDNLDRAIRSCGRYLVSVIPVYYDRKRVARILGEDGETDHATIDPNLVGADGKPAAYVKNTLENGEIEEIYNPSVGKYDVVSTIGPSYTTKRQEALDNMTQLLQGNEQLWTVIGDLVGKNMDWPGAEEFSERMKRWIGQVNPAVLGDENQAQVDPQKMKQAMDMVDQLTKQLHQAMDALESKKAEEKRADYDAVTKRLAQLKDKIPAVLWPEIIVNSEVVDEIDLDNAGSRIHPLEMAQAMQPPQPQQPEAQPAPGVQ